LSCVFQPNVLALVFVEKVKAIAQLLVRLNWTWVGLVRGDHEYGRFAVQGLLRELQGTNVCVAYKEMIPLLYNRQKALEIMQVNSKNTDKGFPPLESLYQIAFHRQLLL